MNANVEFSTERRSSVLIGNQELQRAYETFLRDRQNIDMIMNRSKFRNVLGSYNKRFVEQRMRKKIRTRVICPDNGKVDSEDLKELREVRYLPAEKFNFNMDFKVTDKSVLLTSISEVGAVGVLITDTEIAGNFRLIFEMLWGIASDNLTSSHGS